MEAYIDLKIGRFFSIPDLYGMMPDWRRKGVWPDSGLFGYDCPPGHAEMLEKIRQDRVAAEALPRTLPVCKPPHKTVRDAMEVTDTYERAFVLSHKISCDDNALYNTPSQCGTKQLNRITNSVKQIVHSQRYFVGKIVRFLLILRVIGTVAKNF